MADNFGVDFCLPVINWFNDDNGEPALAIAVAPVERVVRPQQGVAITDKILRKITH